MLSTSGLSGGEKPGGSRGDEVTDQHCRDPHQRQEERQQGSSSHGGCDQEGQGYEEQDVRGGLNRRGQTQGYQKSVWQGRSTQCVMEETNRASPVHVSQGGGYQGSHNEDQRGQRKGQGRSPQGARGQHNVPQGKRCRGYPVDGRGGPSGRDETPSSLGEADRYKLIAHEGPPVSAPALSSPPQTKPKSASSGTGHQPSLFYPIYMYIIYMYMYLELHVHV